MPFIVGNDLTIDSSSRATKVKSQKASQKSKLVQEPEKDNFYGKNSTYVGIIGQKSEKIHY